MSEAELFADGDLDDESLLGEDFVLDDNDEIDLDSFELLGAASLEDIDEDNVVYVYSNSDGIARIEVGTETAEGKVTKINAAGDRVTIGSTAYDLADADAISGAPAANSISLGDTGTAYLDYAGNIFKWDIEKKDAGNYALVIAAAAGNDLDDDRIRLMLADGTKKIFSVDSDAYEDEETYADFVAGDLVTYAVDKDGVIDKIRKQTLTETAKEGKLSKSGTIFAGKQVDAGVVVFEISVKDDVTTPEGVVKLANVSRETMTIAYYAPDSKIEVMIVTDNEIDGGKDTVFAVINTVEPALNDDEDKVHYVTGFANGKEFKAYTDSQSYFGEYSAIAGPGLWELDIDEDGVIVDADFYNTEAEGTANLEDWDYEGVVTAKDGNSVEINKEWYAVDSSAVVYAFDFDKTSNPYSLKSRSDVKKGAYPVLVQIDDESEYYDLVLLLVNMP